MSEIQKKTVAEDWLHVPSKENIADVLTKGASPESLGTDSVWQTGPVWLVDPPSTWPVTDVRVDPLQADALQPFLAVKKKSKVFSSYVKDVDILDMASNNVSVPGAVQVTSSTWETSLVYNLGT